MKNINKKLTWVLLTSSWLSLSQAASTKGDKELNGGDPVEVQFIKAKDFVQKYLESIHVNQIDNMPIDRDFKKFLKVEFKRFLFKEYAFEKMANFAKISTLKFDSNVCQFEKTEAVSWNIDKDGNASICVLKDLNRKNSFATTAALIIHELGHMIGEKSHEFLSDLGQDLIKLETLKNLVVVIDNYGIDLHDDFYQYYVNTFIKWTKNVAAIDTIENFKKNKWTWTWEQKKNILVFANALCRLKTGPSSYVNEIQTTNFIMEGKQLSAMKKILVEEGRSYLDSQIYGKYQYSFNFRYIVNNFKPSSISLLEFEDINASAPQSRIYTMTLENDEAYVIEAINRYTCKNSSLADEFERLSKL